jgi:signal transduction histidine kinase
MAPLLDKLPTILVLAVLVGIFVALRQHGRSNRLQLWTAGWVLIFIHFVAQALETQGHPSIFDAIDLGALQVAAIVFIGSLTAYIDDKKRTLQFLAVACPPVIAYSIAYGFEKDLRALYIVCLATLYYGTVGMSLIKAPKLTLEQAFWLPVAAMVGTWSIYKAWLHEYDTGFNATMTLAFFVTAWLFWMRYRRLSPGVITSAGGFVLWAAVFPLSVLLDPTRFPNLHINPELWNTPKYFVAFGMIVTLLEDKSTGLEDSNSREHKLNQQLQRFSSITSRLLTGVEVNQLCSEIAHAITETSTFRRAGITLSADDSSFYLAGCSGLDDESVQQLRQSAGKHKTMDLEEIRRIGSRVGQNSYLLQPAQAGPYGPVLSQEAFAANPFWEKGNELVVPLQSTRGTCVGWISLDDPRDVTRVSAEEMSKIELLANDLAVTVDNGALHRQLARSEKLAAMGQLVAGVAHELNNPLASVVGYSELLSDEIPSGPARQKLDKLVREAHRMRRIIENLLRFARQNSPEKKCADLNLLLQDVLSLREYHLRNHDVQVQVEIEADLPAVALDEDQFKQILLNLLNNSVDALERAPIKRIRIEAVHQSGRVIMRFDDTGLGFSEPSRVFDPFYTTKPIGKGTGLGLSICYGIAKEHGGDIYALNLEPRGARIVLELPAYDPLEAAATATAGQRVQ